MLLLEGSPDTHAVMAFIDEAVRSIREAGGEPRTILAGPEAYATLREGVAQRFGRTNQHVEQVQWLTVVVDPSRGDRLAVLPTVRESAEARIEAV